MHYMVPQNKTPQHENRNFSEMREYFCTEFCSFVQHITAHESVVSCCIYLTYDGNLNLKNEFWNWTNVDFYKSIRWFWHLCDIKNHSIFMIFSAWNPEEI